MVQIDYHRLCEGEVPRLLTTFRQKCISATKKLLRIVSEQIIFNCGSSNFLCGTTLRINLMIIRPLL